MEENKDKKESVVINNSNEMLVTGVLYGLMFCCEIIRADKFEGVKNPIADILNESYDSLDYKIFNMFTLIREKNRVPDLMKVVEQYKQEVKNSEKIAQNKKLLEKIYQKMKGGENENK